MPLNVENPTTFDSQSSAITSSMNSLNMARFDETAGTLSNHPASTSSAASFEPVPLPAS